MKKLLIFLLTVLFITQNSFCQTYNCFTNSTSQSIPEPPGEGISSNCLKSVEDLEQLPNVVMKINIHYVKGTYGNFYPGPLPSSDPKNGNLYANLFLNEFNIKMANLVASPTSLANKLGDSKIRSQLYTEASNPADLYGGIWYWDQLLDLLKKVDIEIS